MPLPRVGPWCKARAPSRSAEKSQVDCIPHRFMSRGPGMQVISAVVLRIHSLRICGIRYRRCEIDDSIKAAGGFDPGIDCNAFSLSLLRPTAEALVGENGCSENLQTTSVRLGNDLFVACDQFVGVNLSPAQAWNHLRCQGCGRSIWLADIVSALKQNHGAHCGLQKSVAV